MTNFTKSTLAFCLICGVAYAETDKHHHHHHHHGHNHNDEVALYGTIGWFAKSSALASKNENANKDSYSTFFTTMQMNADAPFGLRAGLGITAFTPFGQSTPYVESKFIENIAYLDFTHSFDSLTLSIKGGRFDEHLDWIGHSLQGAMASLNSRYFRIYGLWVDDQAHTTREIGLHNFNFYDELYDSKDLFVAGADIKAPYTHISPFNYHLPTFFNVAGTKINFNFDISQNWYISTTLHGAYLHSLFTNEIHDEHGHEDEITTHITEPRGHSYIGIIEQAIGYGDNIEFGIGFQKVGKHIFELANMDSNSRFEAHNHGHSRFNVIQPGGMHSGTHTTNMYNEETRTIYGFFDMSFDNFAIEALARDSRNSERSQSAYSLGFRYTSIYDIEIGALGVYMLESKQSDGDGDEPSYKNLNRSFAKAYIQYAF